MLFQKQAFRHDPDNGVYGDCHRTAIACLLGTGRDSVPNFGEEDPKDFDKAVTKWLKRHGWWKMDVSFGAPLDEVLATLAVNAPNVYYLLSGASKSGVNHTVVAHGGSIVWDPSLDDVGIVGPCDDGMIWISVLIPECMGGEVGT